MAHKLTSKTFAQASTPSNRIVFAFAGAAAEGDGFISDSEMQFTFAANNAGTSTPTRVQIIPSLIEKVIVTNGTLTISTGDPSFGPYVFNAGVPYDFSELGGLPIAKQAAAGRSINYVTVANTTAQVIFRGYQGAPTT